MKPTQQDIIEFAKQAKLGTALSHGGGELRIFIEGADWHEELLRFTELLLERFGAGDGEPICHLMECKDIHGEPCFIQIDEPEGVEGVFPVYTHPSPTDLRAEYLRGLEDAASIVENADTPDCGGWTTCGIADEIRALKGKQ